MFGIASITKMEKNRQVATKIKKFLLANDESLAVRFSVESQTIHISRDSVSVKVNEREREREMAEVFHFLLLIGCLFV